MAGVAGAPGRKPSALASYTPLISPMNSDMTFLQQTEGSKKDLCSQGWLKKEEQIKERMRR
jgi:hypothetical protein